MEKRHVVRLTDDQRAALEERFAGPLTLRQRNRIQVLLRADRGETDGEIAEGRGLSAGTVLNTAAAFAFAGPGGVNPPAGTASAERIVVFGSAIWPSASHEADPRKEVKAARPTPTR